MEVVDRLNGSAKLMIVSDLDFTMVDHHDPEDIYLLRFNSLWEAYYRDNSLLVYSTGRSPTIYKQLRRGKPLLSPDITILSVGTEIMYGDLMLPDDEWVNNLNHNWDRDIVTAETAKFPQLTPQSKTEQRPHKVSFFVEKESASKVIEDLSECLKKRGLDVKIIYSSGTALDVVPQSGGKGQALAYLLKKFEANGNVPINTLVCGDSGNDAELFTVPGVYGVMVSNAQEELLQWYEGKENSKIVKATERCGAGIMQAIGSLGLGPNISPRDIEKCSKVEILTPAHEVVRFYLFYERWRLGAVERSAADAGFRLDFYPGGILVDASGCEQPFWRCIEKMGMIYGDKKKEREKFRVWVDRISASHIGADMWLVKFDKWESCEKKRQGCRTTALLSSKHPQFPERFQWVHMHQTWLEEEEEDSRTTVVWLF